MQLNPFVRKIVTTDSTTYGKFASESLVSATDPNTASSKPNLMTGELSRSAMPGATGVVDEDLEAYETNYQTHRTGISTEECIQCYNKTAKKYEENLNPSRYRGYVIAAEAVETFYGQDKSARVLDVGAGTGFLGKELEKRGYTNIDALEPASEMLKLAAEKGVYRSLYCDVLGGSEVTIPDDTYDVLALSGSMGEGHIQCKGLAEMVRIVKPGGLVVIVMRREYLEYVKEYADRLEPYMKELEDSGQWRRLERSPVSNYSFGKDGVVFVYRVIQNGSSSMASKII